MWVEHFGNLDEGMERGVYHELRRRIRLVMEASSSQGIVSSASESEIAMVQRELSSRGIYPWECALVTEQDVDVAPESVAALFRAKISQIGDELYRLLDSPIGHAAAAMGCRAEVGFAVNASVALAYIKSAEEGLDVRCEDMRQAFNCLEELLRDSGEIGEADYWDPSTADPADLPGVGGKAHDA